MKRAVCDDGTVVYIHRNGTWREESEGLTNSDHIQSRIGTDHATIPKDPSGFRGVPWGARKKECLSRESSSPDSEDADLVAWNGRDLADLTWIVAYLFVDGLLSRGKYILEQEFTNPERYIREYSRLKDLLSLKYGEPESENDYWSNDLYQDQPTEWGMAVCSGHLSRFTTWHPPGTEILLVLNGENYESSLQIEYVSEALGGVESAQRERKILSDL